MSHSHTKKTDSVPRHINHNVRVGIFGQSLADGHEKTISQIPLFSDPGTNESYLRTFQNLSEASLDNIGYWIILDTSRY